MSDRVTEMDTRAQEKQAKTVLPAYQEGYQAYQRGVRFTCCPHSPGRASYCEWARGWIQADTDRFSKKQTGSSS